MDKKKIKFLIIGVSLIIIIPLIVYLAYQKHGESYKSNDNQHGLNLNSFYDENSLLFKNVEKSKNNIPYSYLQIDGLKKAKVENNINKNIIENLNLFLDNHSSLNNVNMMVLGNFGNILSMSINGLDANEKVINKYINYNLVTGNQLSLNDLFTQNAPIYDIIKEKLLEKLQNDKKIKCNYDEKGNLIDKNKKCEQINSEFNKYIEKIQQGNYQFYFTGVELKVEVEDILIIIPYFEYPEYFNLYTKFLTNVSIYKNDKIGTKDILIASYRDNGVYSILEELEEDLYVDSVVLTNEMDISTDVKEGIKKIIDEEVKQYNQKDIYTFLNQSNSLVKLQDSYHDTKEQKYIDKNRYSIYNLTVNSNVYTMNEVIFEDTIMDNIFESHRKLNKDNFIDIDIDDTVNLVSTKKEMIILGNGKLLEKIEDLFIEGYDYKQVIEKILIAKYNLEENEQLDNLQYDYILYNKDIDNSYSIVVFGNNIKKTYISFEEFEKTMMTVY